jgi:hypothetical protein
LKIFEHEADVIDYDYLTGVFIILILALLALFALKSLSGQSKSPGLTFFARTVIGIIASLTTRVFLEQSGLGASDVTLWSVSIGAGLALALVYRG